MTPHAIFRKFRAYRVADAPERSLLTEAINANAFKPSIGISKEARHGWAPFDAPLAETFEEGAWLFNQYALFSLRTEQRRIPAGLFRAHLDARIRAWCEANKRERCPVAVRTELKEALTMEMLQSTLPSLTTRHVVWDMANNWVVFGATAEGPCDTFRKMFHHTFGLTLETQAEPEAPGRVRYDDPAEDFLAWLMWRSGMTLEDVDDVKLSFYVDGGMRIGEDTVSDLGATAAAALSGGAPQALRLSLTVADNEYRVRLVGDRVVSVRIPALVKGMTDEALYEAAYCYEEVTAGIERLRARFRAERERAESQMRDGQDRWIAEQLSPLDDFLARLRADAAG